MYDYLIVGAGLFGATFAHEMTQAGYKCLVIEKNDRVGGSLDNERVGNIVVHKYGPHIFHTDDPYLWEYVNRLTYFVPFVNQPIANYAISCNMIDRNPCKGVHAIMTETKEREVYTLDEAQEFLEHLENAQMKYRVFFTLAIFGGFRRGEILGLEWSDIDFDEHTISINRTSLYTKEKGVFTSTPKTKSSERTLKLPEEIFVTLREYQKEQTKQRLLVGDRWQDTDRLFTQWDGSPMGPDTVRHWLTKFCEDEGLRYVSIHSFRHLNASLLISNGADVKTVSAALGHAQPTTTMNIYAHSFAQAQARASEALANTLNFDTAKRHEKAKNA